MLTTNKETKQEYDYYITLEELKILVKCINLPKVNDQFKLITWFLILTGRRVGEVVAIQLQDFLGHKSFDFSKLNMRLEKTDQVVTIDIVEPLQAMIREYVVKHHQKLLGGYLFPRKGFSGLSRPYIRTEDYGAFFSKLRKRAGQYSKGFQEVYPNHIFRIHPHSLRHFFEDYGLQNTNSLLFVKELMGYKDIGTVLVYANRKRIREELPKYYERHVLNLSRKLDGLVEGQEIIDKYL